MTSDHTNHGTPIALGVTFCFSFRTCRLQNVARVRRLLSRSLSTRPQSAKSNPIMFNTMRVQAFDDSVQQLMDITEEEFFAYLGVKEDQFPPDLPFDLSCNINTFCSLANEIARNIKATREHRLLCIYLFLTTHNF